jgi:SAM-dependent methyltransferase
MKDEERDFLGLINAAMAVPLRGWDFSLLAGRTISQPLPWDYMQLAQLAVRRARRVLDVDTGGGEVLAAIGPPAGSIAVEPHPPNLALAAATLSPHHVEVRARVSARLPAAGGEVDLVLNRHGALAVQEAFRVLQVGGTLLSQQVGRHNDTEFNEALGVPPLGEAALESVDKTIAALVGAGFQVARCEQARPRSSYLDVGAIVLQLRAVPWQVPGFDVQHHLDQLRRIHHHIGRHGSFTVTSHRLLLIAQRT